MLTSCHRQEGERRSCEAASLRCFNIWRQEFGEAPLLTCETMSADDRLRIRSLTKGIRIQTCYCGVRHLRAVRHCSPACEIPPCKTCQQRQFSLQPYEVSCPFEEAKRSSLVAEMLEIQVRLAQQQQQRPATVPSRQGCCAARSHHSVALCRICRLKALPNLSALTVPSRVCDSATAAVKRRVVCCAQNASFSSGKKDSAMRALRNTGLLLVR